MAKDKTPLIEGSRTTLYYPVQDVYLGAYIEDGRLMDVGIYDSTQKLEAALVTFSASGLDTMAEAVDALRNRLEELEVEIRD